jgi:hypothetical protein
MVAEKGGVNLEREALQIPRSKKKGRREPDNQRPPKTTLPTYHARERRKGEEGGMW